MPSLSLTAPVIGILRGIDATFFSELMPACFEAGLDAIEVTVNTRDAFEIIAANRPKVPPGKLLGMGTVRNLAEARLAVEAGAMFLVSPNLDREVLAYAADQNIPMVAGALTPSEIYDAWSNGAAMVKVFPCGAMGGPQYIRDLRGPFEAVPLVAVGGVERDNLEQYFAAGAAAVGVSGSLFGKQALADRNLKLLTKNVKEFISQCAAVLYKG
jgi:2-dehydro-3-deoxyphosphogluconate aldolase/(4S)-4-hydroxy-2-oxoglutarate aldolase